MGNLTRLEKGWGLSQPLSGHGYSGSTLASRVDTVLHLCIVLTYAAILRMITIVLASSIRVQREIWLWLTMVFNHVMVI